MGPLVFVGPTLAAAEVRARLPDAVVLPPVAVGEVLARVRRRPPRVIAIIDGYFERMAAVWHKELLCALARGVAVWGAASMGALRAAELAPFGMRGVGPIYRAFARGALVADDEVAVAHLPAAHGYRAISDALVCGAGRAAGCVDTDTARQEVVDIQRQVAAMLFGRSCRQNHDLLHGNGIVHLRPGQAVVAVFILGGHSVILFAWTLNWFGNHESV